MTAAAEGAANAFLARLRAGEVTLMLGIRAARGTDVVRIAQAAGYHSVLVDLEHSTMPLDVAGLLCATAGDLGLTAFVRVPEREYGAIGRLLDAGACGIIAPRIDTAGEASTVARACRFAPRGQRSVIATVPQVGMRPTPARELQPLLDRETIVVTLIETPEGVANAEAIAATDGVDMLAVGVNDLTAELGVPGEYEDLGVRKAIAAVVAAGRRHEKLVMVGGLADLSLLADLGGAPLYLTGMDTDLLFAEALNRARRVGAWHSGGGEGPKRTEPAWPSR
jgi:2-keto-3-deoxy-L-rhamnonate aldolase RhmA